jgi:DNA-binding response OmpR family regulator
MRRLREKLGPAAKHLDTVRGVGYRFLDSAS